MLSVIIPTRNRSILLNKVLKSILKQSLSPHKYEIIVVDNGSTDNTKEIVESFNDSIQNLIYYYEPKPGLHNGRHQGLKLSQYDILTYLDDDVELFSKHFEAVIESFKDSKVAIVGGKNLPNYESTPPQWLIKLWEKNQNDKMIPQLSVIDLGDSKKEIDPLFIWGCNFNIRKSVLLQAGGFHPDSMPQELIKYRGDGESAVSAYIKEQSYKAIYNPKVSIYHFVPNSRMTEKYFDQRMYNQGISDSYTDIRNRTPLQDINNKVAKLLRTNTSYADGYLYHNTEASKDEDLMNWILKETYYV